MITLGSSRSRRVNWIENAIVLEEPRIKIASSVSLSVFHSATLSLSRLISSAEQHKFDAQPRSSELIDPR